MKKRIIGFALIFAAAALLFPVPARAAGSLSNFVKTRAYAANQFADVTNQWFAADVQLSYEYGLVDGTSLTAFSPEKYLTIAEAIKLAACLNCIYSTGRPTLNNGSPLWYAPYVDYALAKGIIQAPFRDYAAFATRAEMAVIFANTVPTEALEPINTVADGAIPDVSTNYSYSAAVYKLYRAGILIGTDGTHAYMPNDYICRAEAVAIVTRIANAGSRQVFSLSSSDTPSHSDQPAVYTISAAPAAVTVQSGGQADVSFTVSALDFDRIIPVTGNPSIVSCTWGVPVNNSIPLTVFGLSAGTTDITVTLYDNGGSILSEAAVTVTVTGDGPEAAMEYFQGYYPVPDYGAYAGVSPNYTDYDTLNSAVFYTYRISDITGDMAYAVDGYMNLLLQEGFNYDYSFYSADGDEILVFVHPEYHLKVFFTSSKMNNVPSIIIRIKPS